MSDCDRLQTDATDSACDDVNQDKNRVNYLSYFFKSLYEFAASEKSSDAGDITTINLAETAIHVMYLGCATSLIALSVVLMVEPAASNVAEAIYQMSRYWSLGDGTCEIVVVGADLKQALKQAQDDFDPLYTLVHTINGLQLVGLIALDMAKIVTTPFTSWSFAGAMAICAFAEYRKYRKHDALASDELNQPSPDSEEYNKHKKAAIKHYKTAVAFSHSCGAMTMVALGATLLVTGVFTGGAVPIVFTAVALAWTAYSGYQRYRLFDPDDNDYYEQRKAVEQITETFTSLDDKTNFKAIIDQLMRSRTYNNDQMLELLTFLKNRESKQLQEIPLENKSPMLAAQFNALLARQTSKNSKLTSYWMPSLFGSSTAATTERTPCVSSAVVSAAT